MLRYQKVVRYRHQATFGKVGVPLAQRLLTQELVKQSLLLWQCAQIGIAPGTLVDHKVSQLVQEVVSAGYQFSPLLPST